jgi:hypothetical protein
VLVPLNKARGHDVTLGVDCLLANDGVLGDHNYFAILDPHIAHAIKIGLGVHDPAVEDGDVEVLGKGRRNGEKACREHRNQGEHSKLLAPLLKSSSYLMHIVFHLFAGRWCRCLERLFKALCHVANEGSSAN